MKTILITGGSGMVGKHLSNLLLSKGYKVIWLSRERYIKANIPRYKWDYINKEIDEDALEQADVIVHLAGAGIADGKWTASRKKIIVESRIDTAQLILDTLKEKFISIDAFISASAVGFYGANTNNKIYTETDSHDESDFLGATCYQWEEQAKKFTSELDVRSVSIRTGVVLAKESDLIKKLLLPIKLWMGAPLGSGMQYMSWIHIDDLCGIYLKAIEDETMKGAYNAVAPEFVTNKQFMSSFAKVLHKPFFLPHIPSFLFQMVLGESAQIILEGSRISSAKVIDEGYQFNFNNLKDALNNILLDDEKD